MTFDCQSCGACCVADYSEPVFVEITPAERAAMPRHKHRLTVLDRQWDDLYRGRTKTDRDGNCVCAMLAGRIGRAVRCTVYDTRPKVCRDFRPGSPSCRHARREAGIGEAA